MQPFYQGQLDVFCAIYAVLNGLRLTHGLRMLDAREILHAALLDLAAERQAFADVLNQQTDYLDLVDSLLGQQAFKRPLEVLRPFALHEEPAAVFTRLGEWLSCPRRAALFRFVRYLPFNGKPCIHHWTCVHAVEGNVLRLFDSSRDSGAVHAIRLDEVVTRAEEGGAGRIFLEPRTVRLVRNRI